MLRNIVPLMERANYGASMLMGVRRRWNGYRRERIINVRSASRASPNGMDPDFVA